MAHPHGQDRDIGLTCLESGPCQTRGPMLSRAESIAPAPRYPLSRGEAKAAQGPGENAGAQPRGRGREHTLFPHTQPTAPARSTAPTPPSHPYTHEHAQAPPLPGAPSHPRWVHTPLPTRVPAGPSPPAWPRRPLPSAPTPPSPSRPLGTLSRPLPRPSPRAATPPCSPQTFLSLLLSLRREQHSLPPGSRMAELWRQPPPPPPTQSQEGKFGSGAREPGQPGHPSARAQRLGDICREQGGLARGH